MSKFTLRDVSIVRFVTSGGLALKNGFYSSKSPSVTKRRRPATTNKPRLEPGMWLCGLKAQTEEATELPGG